VLKLVSALVAAAIVTFVPAQLPSVADTGRCYLNPETDKTICEATSLDETTTSQATPTCQA
jgi:hypothetical protein